MLYPESVSSDDAPNPLGEWTLQPSGSLAATFHFGLLRLILRKERADDGETTWRAEVHGAANNYRAEHVSASIDQAEGEAIELLREVLDRLSRDAAGISLNDEQ